MNEQPTTLNDLLAVAGGNRDLKVGFYTNELVFAALLIMVAVFFGIVLANLVKKK